MKKILASLLLLAVSAFALDINSATAKELLKSKVSERKRLRESSLIEMSMVSLQVLMNFKMLRVSVKKSLRLSRVNLSF
jgi:hypothetical protein